MLTKEIRIDGNKAIGYYMNRQLSGGCLSDFQYEKIPDSTVNRFLYHRSWDWLIPVVQRLLSRMTDLDARFELVGTFTKMEIEPLWTCVVKNAKLFKPSEAVIGNKGVFYDNGWTAAVNRPRTEPDDVELQASIENINWQRGLTTLPTFTDDEKKQLIDFYTAGWNAAMNAMK